MSAQAQPNLLDQLRAVIQAHGDAARAQYAGGPAGAPLTPGTGSVLDQRNNQLQQAMPPTAPQAPLAPSPVTAPQDLAGSQAPYGSGPGEQRLDSQGNVIPPQMTGLAGVKRKVGK